MRLSLIRPSTHLSFALVFGVALMVLLTGPAALAAGPKAAKTLGEMTTSVYGSLLSLQAFLSFLSYILGIFFTITGLKGLRDHVVDPDRAALPNALLRLAGAAFFISAPILANTIVASIGGGGVGAGATLTYSNSLNPNTSGTGLEGGLNHFVADFASPFLDSLLPFFCYISGLVFMLIGLQRLAKGTFDDPKGPGYMGTFGSFFVAALLMAAGYVMYTLNVSIFGADTVVSNPLLTGTNAMDQAMQDRLNQLMWGVFIFLRIVGYISVVRGLFLLRGAADGAQVSMMQVSTHLIAGAMLANATAFVLAIQNTFVTNPSDFILK